VIISYINVFVYFISLINISVCTHLLCCVVNKNKGLEENRKMYVHVFFCN
jgi:hypothetical protein